jgi:hypothetical protein
MINFQAINLVAQAGRSECVASAIYKGEHVAYKVENGVLIWAPLGKDGKPEEECWSDLDSWEAGSAEAAEIALAAAALGVA